MAKYEYSYYPGCSLHSTAAEYDHTVRAAAEALDLPVRAGIAGNKLEIDVINLWPNRLIGDKDLSEEERLTRTNIAVTKSWELEPSGLLGPVVLQVQDTP